ncbi:PREDICTED: UDP-glycosyltransferase 73C3-like [Ipomoea nil]|uniref:UDP-glycosyltransferase 73C3-like n=1 Tax=Ipomoea nil TaxID=35883 RepID=UPI000900C2BB|nr:PREDICTED: UDP-glycosyltransferase 73C3-like [Ipomoea nil]
MAAITRNQSRGQLLHFIVFPMMAQSHMLPVIDVARMLARCDGVMVTILTTPVNADRFRSMLHRDRQRGFDIRELELRFPCKEAGLPEGCENADLVPKGKNLDMNFLAAVGMLRPQVEEAMKRCEPPASCIVSDMLLTWTAEIAEGLNIPRIVFNVSSCFSYCCANKITDSGILGGVKSETEMFTVPDVPHNVQVCKAQVKGVAFDPTVLNSDIAKLVAEKLRQTVNAAYGAIVNSFDELEPDYVEMYGGRVWCVGPVWLCNQEHEDQALRGSATSAAADKKNDDDVVMKWLDLQEAGSTIYVSLGSFARLTPRQMTELAVGLESSKRPFIWVLGKKDMHLDAFEDWNVSTGFEERNKGRGVLIREWAPQLLILQHPSVGGFLTHCGWNSVMEAVSFGVPMLTWPLFAEQFLNEKLVVEVLGIGVSLGVNVPVNWDGSEDKENIVVAKYEEIKEGIDKLMDKEAGKERRRKVKELGEKAKKAVQKGGSSHCNLMALIQAVSAFGATKI